MSDIRAQVRFEQRGSQLTAVHIVRRRRTPVIVSLQRALLALGIVVSSYQVRARPMRLVERVVVERRDGGSVEGGLADVVKAAVLPIALEEGGPHDDTGSPTIAGARST